MTRLLCASPRCAIPRRHTDSCPGNPCRGCLPGWAADGLRLCPVDVRRLGENPVKLGELYGELELVLRGTERGGGRPGAPGSASPPRDAVVAMRGEIRHVLVGWCRLVAEERGVSLPGGWHLQRLPRGFIGPPNRVWGYDDTMPGVAAYVAKHAEWLAAQDFAGEVADELAGLASRAWGLAYPSGTRTVQAGPCPLCEGTLTAVVRATDNQLPSEVVCDSDQVHRWTADRWRELDRLVTANRRAA